MSKPNNATPPHTQPQTTYPLIVFQYDLQNHPRRTEHWNLVLLNSRSSGTVYELKGNYDTFEYWSYHEHNFSQSAIHTLRGGCQVGAVSVPASIPQLSLSLKPNSNSNPTSTPRPQAEQEAEAARWVDDVLRAIPIVRGDHSGRFDCQTWVIDAIRQLRSARLGVIFRRVNEFHIRKELAAEMERWERADDTVEERLFPVG